MSKPLLVDHKTVGSGSWVPMHGMKGEVVVEGCADGDSLAVDVGCEQPGHGIKVLSYMPVNESGTLVVPMGRTTHLRARHLAASSHGVHVWVS